MCTNVSSRLDIPTEGLVLVTNNGDFARQMELPQNQIHRVYRARVHGRLNSYKLDRIRHGFDGYKSMGVAVEKRHQRTKLSANTWVQITSTEGQVRRYSLSTLYRIYC
jgi:23S rRNA pseudouridine2605 synthase